MKISELKEAGRIGSPKSAYYHAMHVIEGRWPEKEEMIAKDPYFAYLYAKNIIKGRWPEGEKAIARDPQLFRDYKHMIRELMKNEDQ